MKTVHAKVPVSIDELKSYLDEKLPALFIERRQTDIHLQITQNGNSITIAAPDLYDSFLFKIEVTGTEMQVIKSEHYTDDVNVLTLEDLLNSLFLEYPGRGNINYIGEES